jgi:hypothetical protein
VIVLPPEKEGTTVFRYLVSHPEAFDPDTISILGAALDGAWERACANQIAFRLDGSGEAARDLLAKHIVDMAKQGERDHQRLIEGALDRLKL